MLDTQNLLVGQERIAQVFRYLQALDQLRNPAKRLVREQLWTLWLRELPLHPAVSRLEAQAALDSATAIEESSEAEARAPYIVQVRRPQLTDAPALPRELEGWVEAGWDSVDGTVKVVPEREVHEPRYSPPTTERFNSSDARVRFLETWVVERNAWAERERPARAAYRLYERLYDLHAQITREAERLELVLGDGILNWRRPEGGVHHPLLLQRLQLDFDAGRQEFTLSEADFPVEFYSALFRGMTDVNGQAIGRFREEVESGDHHPLVGSATDTFLTRLAAQLSPHGEFLGNADLTGEKPYPRVARDPVVFLRTRTLGFATALEGIVADIVERSDLPGSLLGVVGVETPRGAPEAEVASGFTDGNEDEQVLLSKPANPEQLAIAQRLERHGSVLVQGPPGTGKTHTIANLIGHLLAQGKTVLVTSHTTKALRVLREKVVPELQPLCVSVLDSDTASRSQLESAVNAIVERLSTSDSGHLRREASEAVARRSNLIQSLRRTRESLSDVRAGEYRDIVLDGAATTPSNAAREVAAGVGRHDWIPAPASPGAPLPLSAEELGVLYSSNAQVSPEDERDLSSALPDVVQLPSPEAFSRLVQAEKKLDTQDLRLGEGMWSTPEGQRPEALGLLLGRLQEAVELLHEDQGWKLDTIAAGHTGGPQREAWENLVRLIEKVRDEGLRATEALLAHGPVLATGLPIEEQEKTLGEVVAHLESGGCLGAFTLLTHRGWKKQIEASRVGQAVPSRQEHFAALRALASLMMARNDLKARWDRQMAPLGAPSAAELGDKPEVTASQFVRLVCDCLDWTRKTWEPLQAEVAACGLSWDQAESTLPPDLRAHADLLKIRDVVQQKLPALFSAQSNRLLWNHIQATVTKLERSLALAAPQAQSGQAPTLPMRLRSAVQERDAAVYETIFNRLAELAHKRPVVEHRKYLLGRLEAAAPAWSRLIVQRQQPHDQAVPPGEAGAAWRWRQFHDELERRDQASAAKLQGDVERITHSLRQATAEVIDRRAWAAQVDRTSLTQRKALIGWAQTVRKIGKGTGKRVPQLQVEARRLMNECRSAVPVWIMPLARVVENFDARRSRFDVVIIDEASQSDMMGLIAFYMGKQVVVVGDDEQVSPDAVGQKLDEVQHLIDEHLGGIPMANLYDGQYSVYDVAKSSFGGTICLREHFRCVPEIIRFSNYLSYDGAIKPLRDASTVHLKPHVVSHRVAASVKDNKVNEKEALAVASLLAAATEQPEYEGLTFGVISLVGLPQAERIDLLLRSHLEPSVYEKRHIVCGNAAHFQGDERDVMFLSVVDTPKDGPLSLQERASYKKRLNVAASRARDQMWVVHSLQPEIDLKPGDLRRRFLDYAQNPDDLARQHEKEEVRVESEFERQVLRRLLDAGYRVVPQWKVGAYRLDLVVEGEHKRLAVECDGDRYHGLDKLPDDMARQAILERLGWSFARIRGSHFFRNPEQAMRPVFDRLQEMEIEPLGAHEDEQRAAQAGDRTELQERVSRRAAELCREWQSEEVVEEVDDLLPLAPA